MNKPLHQPLVLTDEQMRAVRSATAVLRHTAKDRFLADLARALARHHPPLSDHAVLDAIHDLLGLVPVKNFMLRGD
jgi:hypothetical protein